MESFKLDLNGKTITVEPKNLAEQANGNILVKLGGTTIMGTCVMNKKDTEGRDFFPLTVEYEEKYYAAGKIKGSRFMKRENRPSDEAICNGRIIDRAIRPRFNQDMTREIQVVSTVLSWDAENDPDILALIAASTALSISDIPWNGPVGVVRVIKNNGQYILNPTYKERENSELDIILAGVMEKGEVLINMIEGGANEADEDSVFNAFEFAKDYLRKIIEFQKEIADKIGKKKTEVLVIELDKDTEKEMKEFVGGKLEAAIFEKDKEKRASHVDLLKEETEKFLEEKYPEKDKKKYVGMFFESEIDHIVHENAIKNEKRPDGRKIDELRDISCEVGLLDRTHGSGLFTRGQTKALSILTLGSPSDQQLLEGMEVMGKKRFMHHYNFPSYSTGEIKPMRGPGRREIGHGMLAEKALYNLLPEYSDFPYTIRIVSEIVSSNGSSSMASISSSSLALMDAGVPIKRPAAGIAIGLMKDEKDEFKILTDIQGYEDHYGDMDFKVAGTAKGITAIQMDVKIDGINGKIIKEALERAKKARNEILGKIEKTIKEPRKELSQFAPRIIKFEIDPERIGEVIGPGGKVINAIIDQTGVSIDIDDSGLVLITAVEKGAGEKALEMVKNIVKDAKVGEVYDGKVKRVLNFGAFVEIWPGQEGMIHISKLGTGRRVDRVEDVINIGDEVTVKVIEVDEIGRVNLSLIKKK
ncbi:MAG: polyribonucleotide nucleotidyltransferase [Candidatus Nealsonbacteria bacterium]|nr:polyribonucleotide nucleotidyltransferase [Candidatus Nealsonbacteria bacterium]